MTHNSIHSTIIKRINSTVRKPEVFRNAAFSRNDLAHAIGISSTQLTTIIHNEMHTTFLELINTQRIKYVEKAMLSPGHGEEPLESIAFRCGFCSRVTMHRYFFKYHGMSPGEYRRLKNGKQ